jgi:hypothetical protein
VAIGASHQTGPIASSDIGKGAPGQSAFKETGNQHDARERIGQNRGIAAEHAARGAAPGFAGLRIDRELEYQTGRRHREQSSEYEEDIAPAEQVAKHAAGSLTEQLA